VKQPAIELAPDLALELGDVAAGRLRLERRPRQPAGDGVHAAGGVEGELDGLGGRRRGERAGRQGKCERQRRFDPSGGPLHG
jgi:hypothetical protein